MTLSNTVADPQRCTSYAAEMKKLRPHKHPQPLAAPNINNRQMLSDRCSVPIWMPGRPFWWPNRLVGALSESILNIVGCSTSTILLLMYLALYNEYSQLIDQNMDQVILVNDTHIKNPMSPQHSLLKPYSMNHEELLEIRSANIQKWRQHQNWQGFKYDETGIDRRHNLSLQEFWDIYDGKWPVVMTDVVPKWPAFNWTGDFFNQHYGKERVAMKAVDHHLDAAIRQVFPDLYQLSGGLSDQGILSEAISLAVPLQRFYENSDKADPKSWTYIEDELFIPMRPELRNDIGDNKYLEEDFFRMFPHDVRPWNAMLLWGTKYSRSSLHMDPYNWTGTNAVIHGRKWWKLYPPGQDEYLYINKNRRSGFPLDCFKYNSAVDAFDPDLQKYPLFRQANSILFEQLPGEILFIPSGWYHQAYNGEETLAISSQVMNHNNYRVLLEEILKAGSVQRHHLDADIDHMSPRQQVQSVLSHLPREVLERGRAVTRNTLEHRKRQTHHRNSGRRSWT